MRFNDKRRSGAQIGCNNQDSLYNDVYWPKKKGGKKEYNIARVFLTCTE